MQERDRGAKTIAAEPGNSSGGLDRRKLLGLLGGGTAVVLTYGLARKLGSVQVTKPVTEPKAAAKAENPAQVKPKAEELSLEIVADVPSLEVVESFTTDSLPELTIRLATEVNRVNGKDAVTGIVSSLYKPNEFYLADKKTVNPKLESQIANWVASSEAAAGQAKELAEWYLGKIVSTVVVFRDMSLALRMADLAVRLDPTTWDQIKAQVATAKVMQLSAIEQAKAAAVAVPVEAIRTGENTIVKEVERVTEEVLVDQRLLEEPISANGITLPVPLIPFVIPSIGISPQALAAYVHSQLEIAWGLAGSEITPRQWKVAEVRALSSDWFSKIDSQALVRISQFSENVSRFIKLIKFEQVSCTAKSSPCEAWALVFGGLYEEGQTISVTTMGEKLHKQTIKIKK